MGRPKQEKYYHVEYLNSGKNGYLRSTKTLINGRIYRKPDGELIRAIKPAHFKYTCSDIKNVRDMLSEYNIGTIQYNLCKRMEAAIEDEVPAVRFSDIERECLADILYYEEDITDKQKETLKKILDIQ